MRNICEWSWYQSIDLPNCVVHVYQSIYEKTRIFDPNFGGYAILPFTMGITMGKKPKKTRCLKKALSDGIWANLRPLYNSNVAKVSIGKKFLWTETPFLAYPMI